MKKNFCKSCGFLDSTHQVCQLLRIQVDPQSDFCSKFKSQEDLFECPLCKNLSLSFIINAESDVLLCPNCTKNLQKCPTCSDAGFCEFETNPDPTPKVVMQTIRQGNAIMQTQVLNPDRIKMFCQSCGCYHNELGCIKGTEFSCENWKFSLQ